MLGCCGRLNTWPTASASVPFSVKEVATTSSLHLFPYKVPGSTRPSGSAC